MRAFATGGGDAVNHALAARFDVGGAWQSVDAQHVLLTVGAKIGAASLACHIFIRPDIVDSAQFARFISAASVHQNNLDASLYGLLDRGIFCLWHPIGYNQPINFHADRSLDQLHDIRGEVVVVHQTQVVDRTAICNDSRCGIVDALLDDVPKSIVVRSANDSNRRSTRCGCHQRHDGGSLKQGLHKFHVSLLPFLPCGGFETLVSGSSAQFRAAFLVARRS